MLAISKSIQIKISKERVSGPQKIHESYIPRIGGISIYLILFLYSLFYFEDMLLYYIVLSSSLVFFAGFFEDITNKISPKIRLISTIISSIFCLSLVNHGIHEVGFEKIDNLISGTYFPYIFLFCL